MPQKLILIIDDDNRNIFALKAVLKAKGFDCLSAISAQEGFAVMEKHDNVAIVLMDMMMPDMDGYQAIAAMKKSAKMQNIPVLAVTAQAMVGDKERCLSAGASGYVSKPINVDELLMQIENFTK
ncbi:Polar-differentiation response regulator DivK [Pedobacter sp. Bi27]|jgi:two-component system, cell cycle response regulator DivK|uniref:Response regulator n=1 Tax=Pedobacter kyonggii TaxID=1926871 RepID=A0A4Q9HBL8_9SPHI|nr:MULTISPECIES: response regulator [Pedobacter]TBO41587.1 response regulator [Pedobacter kyonggii]CAH0180927.1 Polar-differentiation response regulator DivK [Pedobacter sp. Bi36]CAH0205305.1 Polar-differentiation response regulator DivK [Pedobacter sp. Bi27]CAH0236938.1 Polar-differentiation response regulator DivK [Pedobacter sp. Bi126]